MPRNLEGKGEGMSDGFSYVCFGLMVLIIGFTFKACASDTVYKKYPDGTVIFIGGKP